MDPTAYPLTPTETDIRNTLLVDGSRDQITRYAYDQDNRLQYQLDTLGQVTEYVRDGNGRVVETIVYDTPHPVYNEVTVNPYALSYNTLTSSWEQVAGTSVTLPGPVYADVVPTNIYASSLTPTGAVDEWLDLSVPPVGVWQGEVNLPSLSIGVNRVLVIIHTTTTPIRAELSIDVGADGSVQSITQIPFTPWLELDVAASATDRHTRTVYDAAGRATLQVDALGYVTTTTYDATGNVIATTAFATPMADFVEAEHFSSSHPTSPLPTPDLDPVVRSDVFSAEAWINVSDLSIAVQIDGMGIMRSTTNGNVGDFEVAVHRDGSLSVGNWRNVETNGEDQTGRWDSAASLVEEGQWYHVAVVWDGTETLLYLNGEKLTLSGPRTTLPGWGTAHEIGRHYPGNGYEFRGHIGGADYVQQTAWTAADISDKFAAGAPTWEAQLQQVLDAPSADDQTTRYAYDKAERLTFEVDPLGRRSPSTCAIDNGQVIDTIRYANAVPLQHNPTVNDLRRELQRCDQCVGVGASGSGQSLNLAPGAYEDLTTYVVSRCMPLGGSCVSCQTA